MCVLSPVLVALIFAVANPHPKPVSILRMTIETERLVSLGDDGMSSQFQLADDVRLPVRLLPDQVYQFGVLFEALTRGDYRGLLTLHLRCGQWERHVR